MKINWKTIGFWTIAVIITLGTSVFQRLTGPTHPVRGKVDFEGETVKYKLLRSFTQNEPANISIEVKSNKIKGEIIYKRYKSDDEWTTVEMNHKDGKLEGSIPGLAAAAKVEYLVKLISGDGEDKKELALNKGVAAVARFKGKVPMAFLIPHVLVMFAAMIFGIRTGIEALRKDGKYDKLIIITLILIIIGGMILGPIVQKYAFDDYWTGFPFGYDLTDNKTLLIVIFWIVAFFLRKKSRWWVFAATVLMLIVYLIPHSVLGSELDPKTGKMKHVYGINMILRL